LTSTLQVTCSFAAFLQFPLNLVRDFEKTAPKRPSELALVDATEWSWTTNRRDQ
jgi:hypothetical protein